MTSRTPIRKRDRLLQLFSSSVRDPSTNDPSSHAATTSGLTPEPTLSPPADQEQIVSPTSTSLPSTVQPLTQSNLRTPSISASQRPVSTSVSGNPALERAVQKLLLKIPDSDKKAFLEASKSLDNENLLSRARVCDESHKRSSSLRPHIERLAKFLNFLDRFMGGVAIGIQAYPEISTLVVGAVRIVIDLAIGFLTFFRKLTDMLCQFEDYLGPLAEYAKAPRDESLVQETVANVYTDLLYFCHKARRIFVDRNGDRQKLTSLRVFLRNQWEPFESEFGSIKTELQHHLDILLHTTQALQSTTLREAEQERLHVENSRSNFSSIYVRRQRSIPLILSQETKEKNSSTGFPRSTWSRRTKTYIKRSTLVQAIG